MKRSRHSPRSMIGFTLMELLVVLAIIGILSSLVFAALARAKGTGRMAACTTNVRDLGLAVATFNSDHDEFPLFINSRFFQGKHEAHITSWKGALANGGLGLASGTNAFRFDTDSGVFACPSAQAPPSWPPRRGYSKYGYNGYGLGDHNNPLGLGGVAVEGAEGPRRPVKVSEVKSPTTLLLLGDGFRGWRSTVEDGISLLQCNPIAAEVEGSTARSLSRHRGRAVVGFADSHVERVELRRMFGADGWEPDPSMWQRDPGLPRP